MAGICAGIAVICLLLSGFLFYRVQERKAKQRAALAGTDESTASRRAPTPFKLGGNAQTEQPNQINAHSRSNSSRSFQQPLSRNTSSSTQFLAGQNARLISIPSSSEIDGRSTSLSPLPNSLHSSSAPRTSGHRSTTMPAPSIETSSPQSSTRLSLLDINRLSARNPFTYPPQESIGARSLPIPPIQIPSHPPPSYDAHTHYLPPTSSSLSRDNSVAAASSVSILTGTVHNPSNFSETHLPVAEKAGRSSHGSHPEYFPPSETLHDENSHLDEKLPISERIPQPTLTGDVVPSTLSDIPGAPTSPSAPRGPSLDQDPFENARYEIAGWLNSDPFPSAHRLKHSPSQPSLTSTRPRSTAASSCVLPSDSSIRTLTPEPPSSPPLPSSIPQRAATRTPTEAASIHTQTTQLTGETVVYHRTIEGDGPPVEDLVLMHGAERPGWARAVSALSSLSNAPSPSIITQRQTRTRFPPDDFNPNEAHPLSRTSAIQTQPPLKIAETPQSLQSYRSTFLSMSPLSASLPGPGLGRSYTTYDHRSRPLNTNPSGLSRSNSYALSPPLARSMSSAYFSSGVLSGVENLGFRSSGPYSGMSASQPNLVGNEQRGPSTILSSNIFPADQDSIRSVSPEIGWIGGEDEEPTKTKGTESGNRDPVTSKLESHRQSRFSVGEGGILWGQITSALEAQDKSSAANV